MAIKPRQCVDCQKEAVKTKRRAPYPGPRCASHHRVKKFDRRIYTHEKHILETYGLAAQEYWAMYRHQGGVCAICRRAKGYQKKLSVDHDHATGMIRGLLCQKCNRDLLGHCRDDVNMLQRAIDYLDYPPAKKIIGFRAVPDQAA